MQTFALHEDLQELSLIPAPPALTPPAPFSINHILIRSRSDPLPSLPITFTGRFSTLPWLTRPYVIWLLPSHLTSLPAGLQGWPACFRSQEAHSFLPQAPCINGSFRLVHFPVIPINSANLSLTSQSKLATWGPGG